MLFNLNNLQSTIFYSTFWYLAWFMSYTLQKISGRKSKVFRNPTKIKSSFFSYILVQRVFVSFMGFNYAYKMSCLHRFLIYLDFYHDHNVKKTGLERVPMIGSTTYFFVHLCEQIQKIEYSLEVGNCQI